MAEDFDSLEAVRDNLTQEGVDAGEIDAALPPEGMYRKCVKETQSCTPPGNGNYDDGTQWRIVCYDADGNEYPGEWSPCKSSNIG